MSADSEALCPTAAIDPQLLLYTQLLAFSETQTHLPTHTNTHKTATHKATFNTNKLMTFWRHQSLTSWWRNFSSNVTSVLSGWTLTFLVSLSVVDLLVFLGPLPCYMTQFRSSFSWQMVWYLTLRYSGINRRLWSKTASCPGPVAANQAQSITRPVPCFTILIMCYNADILHFVFISHGTVHYCQTFELWTLLI